MLIVKKFGGSSVANAERINHVAQTIVNSYKEGNQVVVVLSAQGDTTDELIQTHQREKWICFYQLVNSSLLL